SVEEDPVRTFDVQSVEIHAPFELVFEYIADSGNLPEWTHAFASVDGRRATMRTPAGMAEVELAVSASQASGTIDWDMVFPTGDAARAWSRVTPLGADRVIYSFVLPAPPVPLEQLEGTLAKQSQELAGELATLTRVLEERAIRVDRAMAQR